MHNTNAKLVRTITTNNLNDNRTTTQTQSTTSSTSAITPPSAAAAAAAAATTELNRNNIILLRSTKTSENGHILLRTTSTNDVLTTTQAHHHHHHHNNAIKNNSIVLEEGGGDHHHHHHHHHHTTTTTTAKFGQIFIQQSDLGKGVLVQSVKRFGGGTPILLLSGRDNGNGHILIQTTAADDGHHNVAEIVEDHSENILVQALESIQDNEASGSNNGVGGGNRGLSTPIGSGKWKFFHFKCQHLNTKKGCVFIYTYI